MKTITLTGLTLALFVFAGCQTHTPANAPRAMDSDATPAAAPVPPIAVYTVDRRPADAEHERNEAAAALDKKVSLSANAIGLSEAIAFIREATGVNLVVNWSALELVGIDQDSVATVSLKNASAGQLLGVILDQVSADAYDDDKAGYVIRGGIVHISTLRELNMKTQARLYPLDWYANRQPSLNKQIYGRNEDARRMLGMTTLQNKTIDPGNIKAKDLHQGFCATCDASREHDRLEVALSVMSYWEKVEQVIDLIQTTVGDPDEWLDEDSTVRELNGALHVRTTPENHDHIRRLFESMRLESARKFKQQALAMETLLLLEAAEMHRLDQDYRAALKKINEALRVDPNSLEARALKEIVTATLSR